MYRLCDKYPKHKIQLLNRIKRDRLSTRLNVMDELIETGNNTFKENF